MGRLIDCEKEFNSPFFAGENIESGGDILKEYGIRMKMCVENAMFFPWSN